MNILSEYRKIFQYYVLQLDLHMYYKVKTRNEQTNQIRMGKGHCPGIYAMVYVFQQY